MRGPASYRRILADFGSMWRKSCVKATHDISASVLAISTPTAPAPTSEKVSWRADLFGGRVFDRGHFFGSFERTQYSAADEVGIIEGFEAGREVPPFVVAIIVVLNASREDKEVVGQLTATQMDDASAGVDAYDFIQENVNVFLITEDRAQRTEVSSAESRPVATW